MNNVEQIAYGWMASERDWQNREARTRRRMVFAILLSYAAGFASAVEWIRIVT